MGKWRLRFAALLGVISLGGGKSGQEGQEQIATCGSCDFYHAGVPWLNATLSRTGGCVEDCSHLNLRNRGIVTITIGTFDGLAGLSYLSLHGNQITQHPPDLFRNLTALESFSIYDNPLGCVYGVPEDVDMDSYALRNGFYETPRCPANCSINTFYDADMDVCLLCPEGKFTWGVGAVNCSEFDPSCSSSRTTASPTTPSPTTMPSPPAPILCEGDEQTLSVNRMDLCAFSKLYPTEKLFHSIFDQSWGGVEENKYMLQTGGLGENMQGNEWKVGGCGAQLSCEIETHDWVCFAYNECHDVFVPLGYDRELLIVRKC